MPPLTPDQKNQLANALALTQNKLGGKAVPGPLAATDWKAFLAQILQQIGPILLTLIISMLTDEQTPEPN